MTKFGSGQQTLIVTFCERRTLWLLVLINTGVREIAQAGNSPNYAIVCLINQSNRATDKKLPNAFCSPRLTLSSSNFTCRESCVVRRSCRIPFGFWNAVRRYELSSENGARVASDLCLLRTEFICVLNKFDSEVS